MSDMSKWKKLIESASGTVVENDAEDLAHTDHEVSMARSQLLSAVKSATRIAKQLQDKSEEEGLEGWVASKLTMAEDYLQAVADHMDGQEITEGYKVMPPMDSKYVERKGLEGPFTTLSGKVVYYDPKEGSYYDPDTDMYISYDDFQALDKDYSGMKDERDEVKTEMRSYRSTASDEAEKAARGGEYKGDGKSHLKDKLTGQELEDFRDKQAIRAKGDRAKEKEEAKARRAQMDADMEKIWAAQNAVKESDDTCECGCDCGKAVCESCGKKHSVKESTEMMTEAQFDEAAGEKDACYNKVKSRYKVWPSAYASGALVKCRKVGAANWGNSEK